MDINEINNDELRCKVCGKLASEDSHFYKTKLLCNKHYIQMQRHGKIISENEMRNKNNKVCDICGDTKSKRYTTWHFDDEYNGKVLCNKHYKQLRDHGKILDDMIPSSSIENKACCVCGSDNKVHYSKLFNGLYCQKHYSQLYNLGELKEKTIFDKNDYLIENNMAYIILRNRKHKEVGRVIIDIEDLERILEHKWRLGTWGYAEAKIDGKSVLMQRFILDEFDPYKIPDHDNRNRLDNRKRNLKIADKSLNAVNTGLRVNNTSGVTGVSWVKRLQLWRAYINYKGERIELGNYKNLNDAIIARLNAENKYYRGVQPQKELFEKYGVEEMYE